MKAIAIDHYNQALTKEVSMTLKRVQGGDDYPIVLIIYEEDEDIDRKAVL